MPPTQPTWLPALTTNGFAIVPDVIAREDVENLIVSLDQITHETSVRSRNSATYAVRNLLSLVPPVRELANSAAIQSLVTPILGSGAHAVRGLLIDKSPDANWKVAWHQDLSIAVNHRVELPGFGPWSEKAGVTHVQPPIEVLENMLTVRLHLDDCLPENGPLQVLPTTHTLGIIPLQSIPPLRQTIATTACKVKAGGVVLMRPLLLHSSSTSTALKRRRVIHIEYAPANALPAGIQWHESNETKDL